MIHTSITRNCVVFLLPRRLTRSAIYWSKKFDSHKWLTVLVDEVKGKLEILRRVFFLCGSLYYTFTTSFYPHAFYNKWFQTLFKDQLETDPRQCVPLIATRYIWYSNASYCMSTN